MSNSVDGMQDAQPGQEAPSRFTWRLANLALGVSAFLGIPGIFGFLYFPTPSRWLLRILFGAYLPLELLAMIVAAVSAIKEFIIIFDWPSSPDR